MSCESETKGIEIKCCIHDRLLKEAQKRQLDPNQYADSLYQAYLQEP